ncbi:hypothetical protein DFH09DRAFT_1280679 [Mycena vulgaris]|nr:hypothetical protein DFH09DRAFT_1280679 [Mycena vulgaris]
MAGFLPWHWLGLEKEDVFFLFSDRPRSVSRNKEDLCKSHWLYLLLEHEDLEIEKSGGDAMDDGKGVFCPQYERVILRLKERSYSCAQSSRAAGVGVAKMKAHAVTPGKGGDSRRNNKRSTSRDVAARPRDRERKDTKCRSGTRPCATHAGIQQWRPVCRETRPLLLRRDATAQSTAVKFELLPGMDVEVLGMHWKTLRNLPEKVLVCNLYDCVTPPGCAGHELCNGIGPALVLLPDEAEVNGQQDAPGAFYSLYEHRTAKLGFATRRAIADLHCGPQFRRAERDDPPVAADLQKNEGGIERARVCVLVRGAVIIIVRGLAVGNVKNYQSASTHSRWRRKAPAQLSLTPERSSASPRRVDASVGTRYKGLFAAVEIRSRN